MRSGKNLLWSIKNSGDILDKLKARDFNSTSLAIYDFSTLYTTLPHNLIKDKLIDVIERNLQYEGQSKITEPYLITFELSKMDIYLHDISLKLYVIYIIA